MLREVPEVTHTSRRTGRAELDEHAENVNYSEIDVGLVEHEQPKPGVLFAVLRAIPGLHLLGQRTGRSSARRSAGRYPHAPLAGARRGLQHRPAHLASAGPHHVGHPRADRRQALRAGPATCCAPRRARSRRSWPHVPGVVDLQIEPQVEIPQVRVTVLRENAVRYGLSPADVADALETALARAQGLASARRAADVRPGRLVRREIAQRHRRRPLHAAHHALGARVALGTVAEVVQTTGPNTINRENVVRRIVVMANVADRDLVSVVADIRAGVTRASRSHAAARLFRGVRRPVRGQQEANVRLLVLGAVSVAGIFLLLIKCLGSWRAALQVMVNIPLAAIGAVLALLLTQWPTREALAAAPFWQWPQRVDLRPPACRWRIGSASSRWSASSIATAS